MGRPRSVEPLGYETHKRCRSQQSRHRTLFGTAEADGCRARVVPGANRCVSTGFEGATLRLERPYLPHPAFRTALSSPPRIWNGVVWLIVHLERGYVAAGSFGTTLSGLRSFRTTLCSKNRPKHDIRSFQMSLGG